MAEKDLLEKILMAYEDVFADCVNALMYDGRKRIRAEDLQPASTESFYRSGGRIRNQFCDVSCYLMEEGHRRLQYIIGNETRLGGRQVLRKASYQGGAYRAQTESGEKTFPVAAMVLDWTGRSTRIPLSLHKLLASEGASEEDLALVDEVQLMVWHMRNLPEAVRKLFTSDLGFVADFLNEGGLEGRGNQRIRHPEALCEMMEALTNDTRFTDLAEELLEKQEKGGKVYMCEYIDMLEARGEARGKELGENRLAALLEKLHSLGRSEDAWKAVIDKDIRMQLYQELCISCS